MPRRKITIEDAFAVLEAAGIQVQVKDVIVDTPPIQLDSFIKQPAPVYQTPQQLGKHTTKVTLYARHSVGCGGTMVATEDGKQVENAGVESYGPGVCYVPTALASHLLSQDGLARQADQRMLDRQQLCYVVVPRIGNDGQRTNFAMPVDENTIDNIGLLPGNMVHFIR